jgi:hypothetical protein
MACKLGQTPEVVLLDDGLARRSAYALPINQGDEK